MATPRCENCTEEQAVANSQLCDTCEDSFDENARAEGKTRDEYYTELGIIPRFYADADYRRAMKTQWNDGYTACLTNTRELLGLSQEDFDDLIGELANVD